MSADAWWHDGIVYQVYPRSFQDSNGDGVGDLKGLKTRLGYLESLGVDAVWISPIYPSPMADFGYDVADYCGIDPRFGTLDDFDALLAEAHARGLRIILDFVPNHTSDEHPWFAASRRSRDDPKRDWYLWRDPAPGGGPPNNWLSNFGGSAWTLDEATGQYYCHMFLKEQPDLNWRNPEVKRAMFDVLRFWMRRGVDGFRIDVLYHIIKDAQFRDNPPNPDYRPGEDESHRLLPLYTADRQEVQDIVREMRRVTDEFSDGRSARVLIGELYVPLDRLMSYYGAGPGGVLNGLQLPFNFQLLAARWQAPEIDRIVRDYEAALPAGAAPNWVLGNHDKPRIASRIGQPGARLAAMLLLTLRGTPTLYYGDEIGMQDVPIAPGEVQDPFEKREPGKGLGRDPQRSPMPWSRAPQAGFTTGTPWLRLAADWRERNVEAALEDPASILALYKALISLRRSEPALHAGAYEPVLLKGDVLGYARTSHGQRFIVLLNFGRMAAPVAREDLACSETTQLTPVLSTLGDALPWSRDGATLRPFEGVIIRSVQTG